MRYLRLSYVLQRAWVRTKVRDNMAQEMLRVSQLITQQ